MSMDNRFIAHNSHQYKPEKFSEIDPHLRSLKELQYVQVSDLIQLFPRTTPGIYTLSGGRQIGKTTLLKQWMQHLLDRNIDPLSIMFMTGEIIEDHRTLIVLVEQHLEERPPNTLQFIIIDEVTYIKDWDKGIKFLADSGVFENTIVMLTGSDLVLMQEARMRFPGRRGQASQVDFHLYPLSFREFINLKHKSINPDEDIDLLHEEFDSYLLHGGYLTAINDYAVDHKIHASTLSTYSDWIRGDVLKRGKSESYLREFLAAMLKCYGSQVAWKTIADHTSIDHHATIQDYAHLLESMEAIFIQHAILEHKLVAAPKKAKKLFFTDPFIWHSIRYWLDAPNVPFLTSDWDKSITSSLVEGCVANHFRRLYPTFYIKAEGEVDVAYVKDQKFWPVEIKWTNQLHPKDLKQIQKYKNSLILSKQKSPSKVFDVDAISLPYFLYKIRDLISNI